MNFLSKNYGWIIVAILTILPMFLTLDIILNDLSDGRSITFIDVEDTVGNSALDKLYHISGEFAIRWMTAVLTCTPFYIVFGITNLFVRKAMGIAAAV